MDFFVLQSPRVPYPPQKIPISLHPLYFSLPPFFHLQIPHLLRHRPFPIRPYIIDVLGTSEIGFDMVISDVYMPDMDGFKLLEQIGLEMDLPVIMMSADDGKVVMLKGVTHGACGYLIKHVRIEALTNIWQHVVSKKRKEDDDDDDNEERDDSSTLKKPRVVWFVELHQQFVTAVNQLGIDINLLMKIMELMNVPRLTRENVASHLQFYVLSHILFTTCVFGILGCIYYPLLFDTGYKYHLYLRRITGVSQHQTSLSSPFINPQDANFGSLRSLSGIDLQTLAPCTCCTAMGYDWIFIVLVTWNLLLDYDS
ncbi:hypothetical protein UlMin_006939 [Ulmus minor]